MHKPTIRLSRSDIEETLHYAHWIAAKNGAQNRFVMSKYPSYTFATLMETLKESKCLARSQSRGGEFAHFSGYKVRANIEFIDIPSNGTR
jgi:hypothetical protein